MANDVTIHDDRAEGKGSLDTYVILFAVAVFAYIAGFLVPSGFFATPEGAALAPDQYRQAVGPASRMPLFGAGETMGFLNFLFEGLVSGDRNGATVGLMAFILIVGGAFGMIMRTGVIELALARAMQNREGGSGGIVPLLFVVFSLCGAVFGMSEEAIVFALIVVPAIVRMGYDSITGLLVTYVATQIGFATSWMNPFGVVIAQGIADVPALSGMEFRLFMWVGFTAFGAVFAWRYAGRVRENPVLSVAFPSDAIFRMASGPDNAVGAFGWRHGTLLSILLAGIVWVIWGVLARGYYLPEIATQFFAIGLACALFSTISRASSANANDFAEAFKEGAMQLAPAAIVVGIAKGVVILLGGDDPASPSILNTVLYHMSHATVGMADWAAAWIMYLLQSGLNFLVVSGSGQAALTMPLMTPLADLAGVTRQTAVLAFQLGDGLTNIICPASAALMGCLGAAKLDWLVWAKFIFKFQIWLTAFASLMMVTAVLVGYQ